MICYKILQKYISLFRTVIILIMKVVILIQLRGGYWTTRGPSRAGASYGPINLDSYSSWMIFDGTFDRFGKFSFWAKICRLKVGGADFPIVNPMKNYKGNQSK